MDIKNLLITAVISVFSLTSFAQESKKKIKEVGLTFYNLDNYGLIYKIGKEDRLWRFSALSGSLSTNAMSTATFTSFGFNFAAGRERRKAISEKIYFAYGIELTCGIAQNITNTDISKSLTIKENSVSPGLTGILGFHYSPKNNWYIQADLLPSLRYFRVKTTSTYSGSRPLPTEIEHSSWLNFGLNSNSAMISIGLKF
ncbi:MAG: hypothetical protein ACPGVD_08150 [Flavobacteriales bacterium]